MILTIPERVECRFSRHLFYPSLSICDSTAKTVENAFLHECERFYGNYEISGIRKTIHTNRYIMSFLFPDDIKHIIKFIRFIKKNDRLNINTIAYDNCVFRQIYPNKSKNLTNDDKNILKSLK